MAPWMVQVVVVALFALTCGVLTAAWLRGRLGTAAIALCLSALVAWVLSFAAISAEFRSANEFATCDENCTPTHYLTAVVFIASPLLIALAGLGMLVARGSRRRLRQARENHG